MTAEVYHRYPNHLAYNSGEVWTDREDAAAYAPTHPRRA